MIKFKKDFGYGDILSIVAIIFSIFTFISLQKKADKVKNKINVERGSPTSFTSVREKGDSCNVLIFPFYFSNSGENTLTLTKIRSDEYKDAPEYSSERKSFEPDSTITITSWNTNILNFFHKKGELEIDTMPSTYYQTTMTIDSIKNFFERKKSFDFLPFINKDILNVKIAPGETNVAYLIVVLKRKDIIFLSNKNYNDSVIYRYSIAINFKFSNRYDFTKIIDIERFNLEDYYIWKKK